MDETTKNITDCKSNPNKWIEQYTDLYTLKKKPISEAVVRRVAEELVRWARDNDDAFKVSQFYLDKGIPHSTFHSLRKRHECLQMANDAALMIIGNRREIGAIKNKYNANVIMKQMHFYDKDWWKSEVDRATLRAATQFNADNNKTYTIIVDSYKEEDKTETDNMPKEG